MLLHFSDAVFLDLSSPAGKVKKVLVPAAKIDMVSQLRKPSSPTCLLMHFRALLPNASALRISMVSKYFESIPYRLNEETGLIDYEECEKFALRSLANIINSRHDGLSIQ